MTRNIRKIVSVICAVALLLSLCTVSLIGSTSAVINNNDGASVVTNYETLKTYDFDNASGFGYRRYIDVFEYVNGGVVLENDGHGGGVWLATDPAHTDVVDHKNGAAYDTLLRLEAGATYRVTFDYKYLAGATKGRVLLLVAPDATSTVDSSTPQKNGTYITVTEKTNQEPVLNFDPALAEDTAVQKATYIFTVGDKSINLGFTGEQSRCKAWIDNVVIEKGTSSIVLKDLNNEYNFDYTDEAIQNAVLDRMNVLNATQAHYSWYNWNDFKFNASGSDSYPGLPCFTDEGMKYVIGKGHVFEQDSKKIWASNALVYGAGNDDGLGNKDIKYLRFCDEATYLITVKYKVTQVTTDVTLGLAYMNTCTAGEMSIIPGSVVTYNSTTDDWQYLTVAVDTAETPEIADKILTLTACVSRDQKWATVVVDSINIKEKRNVTNGVAIMAYNNKGNVKYNIISIGSNITLDIPTNDNPDAAFAGWYTSADFAEGTKVDMNGYTPVKGVNNLYAKWVNTASVVRFDNQGAVTEQKFAVGLELPDPVRPNPYLFFEGWYTDTNFTTKLTTVPDYDVTLYAKYNGSFLNFNNIAKADGTGSPYLTADPADPDNSVVKFTAGKSARPNFMIPAYDIADSKGFEIKPNTSYIVTYKIKKIDADTDASVDLYQGDKPSGDATTRTQMKDSNAKANSTDEWTNVTYSFTTGETLYLEKTNWSYQNHVFFTIYSGSGNVGVYLDDFCIAEVLDEAPEGTVTINFEANGTEVPPMYGYTGENIPVLAAPIVGGYEFQGWYVDKRLTIPFTATTFGDSNITLYAKWKAVPFLVDFTDYEKGQASERAKFVNENGNDYIDWHVAYATNNTSNTGTGYRIFLNKGGVHQQVELGTTYTFSFKYKLLEGDIKIRAVTTAKLNGWVSYVEHKGQELVINKVTNDWTEGTLTFTINEIDGTGNYLSFGVAGHGHILLDDIVILAGGGKMNLYGSSAIYFDANGGDPVEAVGGDPGEQIGKLPTATKKGYTFNTWFTDKELTTPFTAKTFGEESITLYAGWMLGKFSESFEDFPNAVLAQGISGGYKLYKETNAGYDKANVQNGTTSIYRDGTSTGAKAFTLSRSADLELTVGKQYTLTFYVKPEAINDAAGTISLIGMTSNTGIAAPKSTNVITTVGELKAGEWQKVSYTFTADNKFVGISTTAGNNMYLDNFTITLKGYTGTTTGDTSVSPMIIAIMVILAAGALVVTGKKVFEK